MYLRGGREGLVPKLLFFPTQQPGNEARERKQPGNEARERKQSGNEAREKKDSRQKYL